MKNLIHDDEIISSAIDYVSSILVNGSFEILWDMIEKLFAPLYQTQMTELVYHNCNSCQYLFYA